MERVNSFSKDWIDARQHFSRALIDWNSGCEAFGSIMTIWDPENVYIICPSPFGDKLLRLRMAQRKRYI